jgi:hypothetical protein
VAEPLLDLGDVGLVRAFGVAALRPNRKSAIGMLGLLIGRGPPGSLRAAFVATELVWNQRLVLHRNPWEQRH